MDGVSQSPVVMVPPSTPRRLAGALVIGICLLLLVRIFGLEPYEVPTGSMAPTILGHHRTATCPRCGAPVVVGRHPADPGDGRLKAGWYDRAWCPNCGCTHLHIDQLPEAGGDHLLVSKSVFLFRRPRRWEIVVFRLLGKTFIKRIVGLPGEILELLDGDLYIDHQLARKSLAECRAMRVLVFDNNCQPQPAGWCERWVVPPGQDGPHPLSGTELRLDGTCSPENYRFATYRHYLLDERQSQALRDEYSYNGAERRDSALVHDFMVECDVEVGPGEGQVFLSINDGSDTAIAEIPTGTGKQDDLALVLRAPAEANGLQQPTTRPGTVHGLTHSVSLQPGRNYHLELAFVDRRISLAIDGTSPLPAVDLPPATDRPGVERPVTLGARGVQTVFRNFRLFRDVHYTQAGSNAVNGKAVHLGPEQYFVLGDNSASSDDSRFWPNRGVVPADSLVGKPFLVHLPSRVATWEGLGRQWQSRVPDWGKVRWLR